MSIIQFVRILWAYRLLTLLTLVTTLIGAIIAVLIIPPSYEGKTRVMLNTLKPDPVTGETINNAAARTYITTQTELIRDIGVAGQAVDSLGWVANAQAIKEYSAVSKSDNDLRRAMAQQIIERTKVDVVTGTNILEISFRAATPDEARLMANALRDAYVESTLNGRRRDAARNADWYTQQALKERDLLAKADEAKTDYERQAGIVMQDEKTDVETARLRALAMQQPGLAPSMPTGGEGAATSPSAMQLVQLDAQIAETRKTLGPNHPTMIQLQTQRAALAKIVAEEQAQSRNAAATAARAMSASAGALDAAVRQQTTRVIANRDKIEHLNELQGEVNLHREQMEKSLARATELRQEAAVADSGITVLSDAVTPRNPSFPNVPLILGGAVALGGALGLFLSLIIELVQRRVRGVEDLESAVEAPMLAVVSIRQPAAAAEPSSRRRLVEPRGVRTATA